MFAEDKILVGCNENAEVFLLPKLANRHGLIAGATGTGKTFIALHLAYDNPNKKIKELFDFIKEQ